MALEQFSICFVCLPGVCTCERKIPEGFTQIKSNNLQTVKEQT